MTEGPTAPTNDVAEIQAQMNAELLLNGSGTTIVPWGHVVFIEKNSSIHGKSQRPVS